MSHDDCSFTKELGRVEDLARAQHSENKDHIKRIESTAQSALLKVLKLETELRPYLGRKGYFDQMREGIDSINLRLAEQKGGEKHSDNLIMKIGILAIPILMVIIQHYWK